jgi:hypothetical protein
MRLVVHLQRRGLPRLRRISAREEPRRRVPTTMVMTGSREIYEG